MLIGGFQKCSMIDYPDKLSAIVFSLGCNFRCPYCHNPELVLPEKFLPVIDENTILDFLKTRIGKLDGVVLTGGEPCLQKDLIEFAKKIKDLGFAIKLDTNGTYPATIEKFIKNNIADYFAMDIKTTPAKYQTFFSNNINFNDILSSIDLIMNSDKDYEFRTTVVKSLITIKDFDEIGSMISGANKYFLQKFEPTKLLNESFSAAKTYSNEEFRLIINSLKNYVKFVDLR